MKIIKPIEEIKTSEKASGFVETLIAILVAGIGCAALLALSAKVIRQVKENEIRDAMTQAAVEGLEDVRNIAITSIDAVPDVDLGGSYYLLTEAGEFEEVDETNLCSNTLEVNNNYCSVLPLDETTPNFFYREVKLDPKENGAIEVTVYVGRFSCPNYESASTENRCNTSIKGFIYGGTN